MNLRKCIFNRHHGDVIVQRGAVGMLGNGLLDTTNQFFRVHAER